MQNDHAAPRRIRVERNIYRRASGVYEVGFKDVDGKKVRVFKSSGEVVKV